jgi:hypothetical protein
MARWNVGLCGSEPAILNSAAKRFKTQCFSTTPRVYSVFFAFMGLDFDPCPSPCPWPPGVQKEKTVTIREKLIGTNTGTSAPLTAPFFGRFWGRHRDQRSQLCNSGSCRLPRSWSLQSLTLEDVHGTAANLTKSKSSSKTNCTAARSMVTSGSSGIPERQPIRRAIKADDQLL